MVAKGEPEVASGNPGIDPTQGYQDQVKPSNQHNQTVQWRWEDTMKSMSVRSETRKKIDATKKVSDALIQPQEQQRLREVVDVQVRDAANQVPVQQLTQHNQEANQGVEEDNGVNQA